MTAKYDEIEHSINDNKTGHSAKEDVWVCGIPYQGIPIATVRSISHILRQR